MNNAFYSISIIRIIKNLTNFQTQHLKRIFIKTIIIIMTVTEL